MGEGTVVNSVELEEGVKGFPLEIPPPPGAGGDGGDGG